MFVFFYFSIPSIIIIIHASPGICNFLSHMWLFGLFTKAPSTGPIQPDCDSLDQF